MGPSGLGQPLLPVPTARGGRRALVPVADMFDHGRADATWAYVDGPARFEVRAARDLGAGQEIQISYGRSGNASLVSTYGFAMADNGEDEALLDVATAAGVHHLAVGSHYDRRFQLAMAIAGPDGDDLAAMARIAAAARATIAAISKAPLAASGSPAWQASCQQVRAGEVATAAAIVEFVERVTAAGLIRSDAAWAEVIDSLEPAVTGAARMLRELAEASRADDA